MGVRDRMAARRWRASVYRAFSVVLVEDPAPPFCRLDGWLPTRTGLPLDIVVVKPDAVQVWLVPRRPSTIGEYHVEGIADSVTVVVPEGWLTDSGVGIPEMFGIATVGIVAGRPALLQMREPARLHPWYVTALGELLSRDELADVLASLGRTVSPFAVQSMLLAELLDILTPEVARSHILGVLTSG